VLLLVVGPSVVEAALALEVGLQVGDLDQLDRLDRQVAAVEGQGAAIQWRPSASHAKRFA
jgi:hypothetical protein